MSLKCLTWKDLRFLAKVSDSPLLKFGVGGGVGVAGKASVKESHPLSLTVAYIPNLGALPSLEPLEKVPGGGWVLESHFSI